MSVMTIKEYEPLNGLDPGDKKGLREFALANQTDQRGKYRAGPGAEKQSTVRAKLRRHY